VLNALKENIKVFILHFSCMVCEMLFKIGVHCKIIFNIVK